MRWIAILSITVAVLLAAPATAQKSPGKGPSWEMPGTLEEYRSWSLEKRIEIYRAVVANEFYLQWRGRRLAERESRDPSLGGYDEWLSFLPLSPQDMLKIDMLLRHYEVAVPRITNLLHQRWLSLHFGPIIELSQSDATPATDGIGGDFPLARTKALVDTNRNSAYDYSPAPDDYDGEIQVVVNPLNANQVVSMANTWGTTGDDATCSYGTQAIFFSSNGGISWGYTCAPRGKMYGLSCASDIEFGSDPALYWDDANNVFANYMSICYNADPGSYGYAMVVAKSTDGGATWTPHGVLKDSYVTPGTIEDKNFYIIDNHSTSSYYGRHYACWDRNNNELIRYSTDGGVIWNEENIPDVGSGLDLGCEMAVEDDGTVHLIFDNLTCGFTTCSDEDMYYTRSTDGGVSWSSLVHVRDITDPVSFGSNSEYGPQDQRGLNPFGAIDVDNSGGACDGYLYVTFTDDADANGVGTADIWVMRSTDGGGTWGPAVRVNDTPDPDTSIQFHPFLVIDQRDGAVFVTWHDARNDPNNRAVDFYVARSTDCGQTWENVQASQPSPEFNNSTISYTNLSLVDHPDPNPNQYGEYMGLDVHNGTAYLAWTDTRHFFPTSPSEPQEENVGFAKVTFCEAVPPTGLGAAASGDNAIQLTWSGPLSAAEYRVYRSTTPGSGYTQVAAVTAPTTLYLDAAVHGGVTYYYVVTTYDGALVCESVFSSEASATATGTCDLAPTFTGISSAASNGDCAIELSWSTATAICDGPVDYSVYRWTTSGFTPSLANRIAAGLNGTSYTDSSGMTSGTTYYYIVRATDQSNGQEDANTVEQSGSPTGPGVDGTWSTGAESGDPAMYTNGSWSISSAREHSGTFSYYSGYSNNLCAYLRTPQLTLTAGQASTLTYWTAWSIEYRWDGGVVEISTNGGSTWSTLTPTPGYPGTFRNSADACGYATNQASYTGLNNLTFASYTVDLSAYDGQDVMIRWNFSTDGSVTEEGWYVDDIAVTHVQVSGPCASTPFDVAYLTARSTSEQVKLEWVNPSGAFASTRICRDTSSYPTDPEACATVVVDEPGTAGDYDTYSDGGVDDGTKYYYTAFVNNGSGVYSGGRTVSARPFDTSGSVKWAYTTGAAALAPSGIIPGDAYYMVSNDRVLHAGAAGSSGGNWPPGWKPAAMNAPAQGRPTVIDFGTPTVPNGSGASTVAFVGSQDGRVYAFDADTGAELWASEVLGDAIQASPGGVFQIYGAAFDLVLVGTRSSTGASKFFGLDLLDGSEAWSFDNGGESDPAKAIGIISSQAWVDQDTSRVYFTSRAKAGGSDQTVWCIDFTEGSATFRWSAAVGDIDAAPTLWNNVLYVGNTGGTIYAFNADLTGTDKDSEWSKTTSDGAVKGNVWANTQAGGDVLYFSTNDTVHAITDGGDEFPAWTPPSVPGGSPVFVIGDDLFVGSSTGNGSLLRINKFSGAVLNSVGLGDAGVPKSVGSGTYDYLNDMIVVGCGTGEVFSVVADF